MRHLYGVLGMAVVALLFGTLVSGDDKPPKGRNYLPSGWKKLDLSATQKEKIYTIQGDYKKKIDDLNKQVDALKKQRTKELLAVLSKKQKEQLVGIDEDPKDKKPVKDKN